MIVKEPYATQLVTGKKDVEYRSKPLPESKKNQKVWILNKGFVKGYVVFAGSFYDEKDDIYKWFVIDHKQFSPYLLYKHRNGCVVWINDVDIVSEESMYSDQ